jgi:oligosaccharide repeat unit polymerase
MSLDISYIGFVSKIFSVFILNINNLKLFESYIILISLSLLIIFWFPNFKKPSYAVIYLIFIILITPMLTYYAMTDSPRPFIYLSSFGLFSVMLIIKFSKRIRFFYLEEGRTLLLFGSIIFSFYVFANLLVSGGFTRLNFDLEKVYEVREAYGNNRGPLMGYFLFWQAYSINTLLLAYFLYKKHKLMILISLSLQLLLFGMTGFKSFLFSPLLIIGIHYILNVKKTMKLFPYLALGSATVVALFYGLYTLTGDLLWASIFIRRFFFTPAHLHFIYYDFFQLNPKIMLSNSVLSFFIDNPYKDYNILHLISQHYFGKDIGVNVGYIGNAYANFGAFGVFLFSILLGFTLKFLDSISEKLPVSVAVSIIIIPSMAFINSGFFTVLMTHGFIFSCLCVWLLASKFVIKDKKTIQ